MSKARQDKKDSKARAESTNDEVMDEKVSEEGSEESSENSAEEVTAEVVQEPEISVEEKLTQERDSFRDKWMRAVAETDNVRKRARREVNDSRRFAQAETLRPFLDVYDNFERALQSMNDADEKDAASVREGVELIFQKFQGALKDRGAVKIEVADCEFDPNVHEAVGQLPREGMEPGMVIEVAQQGFKYGDMVLRPARVIVSS